MRYLVTTKVDRLPLDHQIIMVDGTVPGWQAGPHDLHWDHHRPHGAEIQMDEIPLPHERSLIEEQQSQRPPCLVTTMVDADACCAAAWVQLPRQFLQADVIARLQAIAWDCDHLIVPESLKQWEEFAAKAVVALKRAADSVAIAIHLPRDRQVWTDEDWEAYSSECFRHGTEWLIEAVQGKRPYPGEQGEADNYWASIALEAKSLLEEHRIELVETERGEIAVCHLQGLGRTIDPRSFYQALKLMKDIPNLRPETLTVRDHRQGGAQYTLGSLPLHPETRLLDYTAGIFEQLTAAEQAKDPTSDGWGGRRTVGGSPWNTPSQLSVAEIINILGC